MPPPPTSTPKPRWQRWLALILATWLGLFVGVSGYTFYFAKGYSYLSDDPTVCVNCHIMRDYYDGWQKGSHHGHAVCNDCHLSHDSIVARYATKAENGFWHSYGFTLNNFHEPIRLRERSRAVLESNCQRCHAELTSEINNSTRSHPGLVGETLGCVHCHNHVGHGPAR
jgi:cytochrome c nitrite reductase small subunit